ncbi:unnamed protein product [Sordaria macrospora k-hell]|uniref:WGS project CABT00000000 data, contig 2.44 n=1 Tax=Sordaria macrospora (strain ATCC MYA-333 / DSM 997 / K(L3346) / K-hell) TaxID=771870 RepID=F7W8E4_SORMK|nr:uncharacterized protein SMAC_07298 [Sordaria macrospora k-hell]CCC13789.1 unnamed protein product [Sordaria macrospora k-hell]
MFSRQTIITLTSLLSLTSFTVAVPAPALESSTTSTTSPPSIPTTTANPFPFLDPHLGAKIDYNQDHYEDYIPTDPSNTPDNNGHALVTRRRNTQGYGLANHATITMLTGKECNMWGASYSAEEGEKNCQIKAWAGNDCTGKVGGPKAKKLVQWGCTKDIQYGSIEVIC